MSSSLSPSIATSISASIEPPAKRQKTMDKPSLRHLSARDFVACVNPSYSPPVLPKLTDYSSTLELYDGPKVLIVVEGEEFKLPKALVCYYSTVFNRAFNSNTEEERLEQQIDLEECSVVNKPQVKEEGPEQRMDLEECSVVHFEYVVQYMYTTNFNLKSGHNEGRREHIIQEQLIRSFSPAASHSTTQEKANVLADEISEILKFLQLVDRLDLLGSFDSICNRFVQILRRCRPALTAEHIRTVASLPARYNLRRAVVHACARPYSESLLHNASFCFQPEIEELTWFAAGLLQTFDKMFRTRTVLGLPGDTKMPKHKLKMSDPFAEKGPDAFVIPQNNK